jgi:V/A-type H+-transporting ATPase subunit I
MIGYVMILNILNGAKHRRWDGVLFGANGAAGFVFYFGIIIAAALRIALGINLFHLWYTLPVLILPLLLILLREPLWLLIKRDPELKRLKIGGIISVGFFELFETVLSYLTNTLSFLRIGAYAITHVGLMLVVKMLAGENQNILVHIIGNIFVIGFEGLLVGIQVLRLEFYELFGRFYDGGGKPFSPRMIDYSS